jgi:ankyrin repeat protein
MKRILFSIVCISLVSAAFAGTDVSDKNDQLIQAAEDGNLTAAQAAIANGADVNTRLIGTTALMVASYQGHTDIVKLLLEKGVDVNSKATENNITALFPASQNGHTEVVKLLLGKGADVNAKATSDGATALWMASQNGHTEVVKLLLERGANVNVKKTDDDATALYVASQNGHTEVVKLLLEKGANVNAKAKMDTGRRFAEKTQNGPFLYAPTKVEYEYRSPLSIAKERGYTKIIELLEKAGAKE